MIRDLMFGNRRHFRELLTRSEAGIASNILADRLKRLKADPVSLCDDPSHKQKAIYSLTEASIALVPLLAHNKSIGLHQPEKPTVRSDQKPQGQPNQQPGQPVQEDRSTPLLAWLKARGDAPPFARVKTRGMPSTVRINGPSGDVRMAVVSPRQKLHFGVGTRIRTGVWHPTNRRRMGDGHRWSVLNDGLTLRFVSRLRQASPQLT